MHPYVFEYYAGKSDRFSDVIVLSETRELSWTEVQKMAPDIPRGWFELAHLCANDRMEFVGDFWLRSLPFIPAISEFMALFFASLEDVAPIMWQHKAGEPYQTDLVYSMAGRNCFFRGGAPLSEEKINFIKRQNNSMLPADFCDFYKIHNGFAKNFDEGLFKAESIFEFTKAFQESIQADQKSVQSGLRKIEGAALIPFYRDLSQESMQCFYLDWYPSGGVGNVALSARDYKISDLTDKTMLAENMAFVSFLDWLVFYMEEVEF